MRIFKEVQKDDNSVPYYYTEKDDHELWVQRHQTLIGQGCLDAEENQWIVLLVMLQIFLDRNQVKHSQVLR